LPLSARHTTAGLLLPLLLVVVVVFNPAAKRGSYQQ
jgi:hypothetical protein